MLASRVLPPIARSSPPLPPTPVATFFNIPRRYVRSNMQVGDNPSDAPMDDGKPSRSLRKSSRITDSRSAPTSSPVERAKQAELQSPTVTSPRSSKKWLAPLVEVVETQEADEQGSLPDDRAPPSATSTGSPDFSGHVCLCQPEPKIPRPRNGKPDFFLCSPFRSTRLGGVT